MMGFPASRHPGDIHVYIALCWTLDGLPLLSSSPQPCDVLAPEAVLSPRVFSLYPGLTFPSCATILLQIWCFMVS